MAGLDAILQKMREKSKESIWDLQKSFQGAAVESCFPARWETPSVVRTALVTYSCCCKGFFLVLLLLLWASAGERDFEWGAFLLILWWLSLLRFMMVIRLRVEIEKMIGEKVEREMATAFHPRFITANSAAKLIFENVPTWKKTVNR